MTLKFKIPKTHSLLRMLEQALEGAKRVVDECDTQRYLYSLLVRLEAVSPFDMHYETK